MDSEDTSAVVALAIGNAFKNGALSEAVFQFGETHIILTKVQAFHADQIGPDDAPPSYPAVPTNLINDDDSWLS